MITKMAYVSSQNGDKAGANETVLELLENWMLLLMEETMPSF